MIFENGIDTKYRRSVDDAFATILDKGDEQHKRVMNAIIGSGMRVQVGPVEQRNASGQTFVPNPVRANARLLTERLSLEDAFREICIFIAEETIDTGGQRGCEGTFVHEGQHAFDFAEAISSYSNRDVNPLAVSNPSLYELEWAAHQTAGRYMLLINKQEYLDEGLDLMILGRNSDGTYLVNDDGIRQRLNDSYGLQENGNVGPTAFQIMGIIV
ncbi:MAG: hypothetical protein ACJ73D_09270, partial [Pyrinomonadaceae bacterium]